MNSLKVFALQQSSGSWNQSQFKVTSYKVVWRSFWRYSNILCKYLIFSHALNVLNISKCQKSKTKYWFYFSTMPSGWVTFTPRTGELTISEKKRSILPEGLGEFLGADRFVAVLQFIENPLQCQGNTLARVVSLCRHHVHRLGRESGWLTRASEF